MAPDSTVADIARAINLALAPVFLLTGVAITLSVLTSRLARIIDRARALDRGPHDENSRLEVAEELGTLARRGILVNTAITLSTMCALLASAATVVLFIGVFSSLALSTLVALLFGTAMIAFIGALVSFLGEISLATASFRIAIARARRGLEDRSA